MATNTINQNIYIVDIQKTGMTPDNRQSYTITDKRTNEHINVSVNSKDCDIFEKSLSSLNQFGENATNPKELKKNKIKAYSVLSGLGLTGILVPAYLTRKSKTWVKALSISGGAAVGIIAGMIGFVKSLIPSGFKNAVEAQNSLRGLDIRTETQSNN